MYRSCGRANQENLEAARLTRSLSLPVLTPAPIKRSKLDTRFILRHAGGVRTNKTASDESRIESTARRCYQTASPDYGPKRWRYSSDVMNALTISASMKLPLNRFSLFNQN